MIKRNRNTKLTPEHIARIRADLKRREELMALADELAQYTMAAIAARNGVAVGTVEKYRRENDK